MEAVRENGSSDYFERSLCSDICFLVFPSPPNASDSFSEWMRCLKAIDVDLHKLLKLPHRKFWAQAIHDSSLQRLLDSYLTHSPRPYEVLWAWPDEAKEVLCKVNRKVFMTFLRLSTYQESKECQMQPTQFGELIYNNYLFTVPRLLDMCSLYGHSNRKLLYKMIHNVFDKQQKYWDSLKHTMSNMEKVFDTFAANYTSQKGHLLDSVDDITQSDVMSSIYYFTDIIYTLKALIHVYPPTCHTLWEVDLPERLVKFFAQTVPTLKSQWKHCRDDSNMSSIATNMLSLALRECCNIINSLISSACSHDDSDVTTPTSADDVTTPTSNMTVDIEHVIDLFNTMFTENTFLKEFEKHHNLQECLQAVQRSCPSFDTPQVEYILSAAASHGGSKTVQKETVKHKPHPPKAEGSKTKSNISHSQKIQYIKEVLPHLDDELIEKCLKEFNDNHEIVVQRCLDNQLPPHIAIPPEPVHVTDKDTSYHPLLEARANVYDHDEFDVIHSKDIDLSRVHIGKKHESAHSILSDRSHVALMKGRGLDIEYYDDYDDEYDDTYDSHNVGAIDQDSADELTPVNRLNDKGQYSSRHNWEGNNTDEFTLGYVKTPSQPLTVTDSKPVKLLKRRVDHPPSKEQSSGKGSGQKGGKGVAGILPVDDDRYSKAERKSLKTEEEKKQKQDDKKEQHHRQYKERHKGSKANHNRKAAADKKRKAF